MSPGKYLFWFIVFVVILTPILDIALERDYQITLPHDYSLSCVKGKMVFMTNADDIIIISPNIDGYDVYGNIVIGHVSDADVRIENAGYSIPGYFLVNTERDEIRQGLGEGSWRGGLLSQDINRDADLSEPSVLDEYLSLNGPKLLIQRFKELFSKIRGIWNKPKTEE